MKGLKIISLIACTLLTSMWLQAQSINSISAVSTITEGSENGGQIAVNLSGGSKFVATLTPANWAVAGLPAGVSVGSISRIDTSNARITLSGNRIKDYDEAQTITVNIQKNQFQNDSGTAYISKSSNSILTFINDAASISFTTGSICEGFENNAVIEVKISGGTFPSLLDSSKWTFSNLPAGVTVGHVAQIDISTAHVTLSGNRTIAYVSDINLNLTIDLSQYDDHTVIPVNLSTASGFTLRQRALLSSTLTPSAICSNSIFSYTPTSPVAGTSFAWTRAVVAGISNLAGSGNGNPSETLINTTSSPDTVTYIYTLTANGCTNPSSYNVKVVVNPSPNITSASTATICSGTSPNISLTASAPSTFAWSIGGVTNGITGSSAGSGNIINQTLTNPSATAGTVTYVVTPTSISGSCTGTSYNIIVTVNPSSVVTNSATSTICSGTNTGISLTASVPSTFAWTIGTITGGITGAVAGSGTALTRH